MQILQMSASYHLSKLYKNMFEELDSKDINQTIYIALKNIKDKNKNKIENGKKTNFVYSAPFKRYDSFIYYTKINKIYKDFNKKINLKEIELIHAHFLFSDGGVAYEAYKKHNIPYIVAVRNTDLNIFFKYALHVRKYGINILKNAKKIILISESYRQPILSKYIPEKIKTEINNKMITIPNGIDKFWLENKPEISSLNMKEKDSIRLVYVGRLDKNKNLETVFNVMEIIEKEKKRINLKVVGTGMLEEKLKEKARAMNLSVEFYGYIKSKEKIKEIYRKSDIFIMPSIQETFGLVYIEAMSQGLPVIYTENQGIYGYFKEGSVGFGAKPKDVNQIRDNIYKIIESYNKMAITSVSEAQKFNWNSITDKYIKIYKEILKEVN